MAIFYDFPTNFEQQLIKCDELIDKGYIDQAICYIEDLDFKIYSTQSCFLFKKKLMTCYMLKKEFEVCQNLIVELEQKKTIDLSVRAHEILLAQEVSDATKEIEVKRKHADELGVTSSYYRSLLELIAELKAYYENYWMIEVSKKVSQLIQEPSIQEQFYIISDLQSLSAKELSLCEGELKQYFAMEKNQITKTLLAEVLIQKGLILIVEWKSENESISIELTQQLLTNLHQEISDSLAILMQQFEMNETSYELIHQHIMFFYQFICPFETKIDKITMIQFLIEQFGIESAQKSDIIDLRVENKPIINYTTCKLRQYLLSLTSLI